VQDLRALGLTLGTVTAADLEVLAGSVPLPVLPRSASGKVVPAGRPLGGRDRLLVLVPPPMAPAAWALPARRHLRIRRRVAPEPVALLEPPPPPRQRPDVTTWQRLLRFEEQRCPEVLPPMRHDEEFWCWSRLMSVGDARSYTCTISAPGRARGPAQLALSLFSQREQPGTRLAVAAGGQPLGVVEARARGWMRPVLELDAARLPDGTFPVTLQLEIAPDAQVIVSLDAIELRYPSTPVAHEDHLALPLRELAAEDGLEVSGFSSRRIVGGVRGEEDRWRWLRPLKARRAQGGYRARLGPIPAGSGTLLLWGEDLVSRAAVSAVSLPPGGEDEPGPILACVVAPDPGLRRAIEPLLDLRRAGGWQVRFVDPLLAYATHGDGTEAPGAIRQALALALSDAPPAGVHILLVGPASYDGAGHMPEPKARALLPCFPATSAAMITGSDVEFADLDRDGLPEHPLGRIPAATETELEVHVAKLCRWASQQVHLDRVLLAADRPDTGGNRDFPAQARALQRELPAAVEPVVVVYEPSAGAGAFRRDLAAAYGSGVDWVTYVGHGSIIAWGEDAILQAGQVPELTAPRGHDRPPVVLAAGCLSAYHLHPSVRSLAETFLFTPQGGALAYIGSTTIAGATPTLDAARTLLRSLVRSPEDRSIGEVMLGLQRQLAAGSETLTTLVLLGDPTLPAPVPRPERRDPRGSPAGGDPGPR
jgi:hypothetical protein